MEKYGPNTRENNPCFDEQELSKKCMRENDYDTEKCLICFENYNICKRFWGKIESNRRDAGIEPNMPTLEERLQIRAERMKHINESRMKKN